MEAHSIVERSYSWLDVAKKTEMVYTSVMHEPVHNIKDRIMRYHKSRTSFGLLFMFLIMMNQLLLMLFDWLHPRKDIDIVPTWRKEQRQNGLITMNGDQWDVGLESSINLSVCNDKKRLK